MKVQLLSGLSLLPVLVVAGCFGPRLLALVESHFEVGRSLLILHGLRNNIGYVWLVSMGNAGGRAVLRWSSANLKVRSFKFLLYEICRC